MQYSTNMASIGEENNNIECSDEKGNNEDDDVITHPQYILNLLSHSVDNNTSNGDNLFHPYTSRSLLKYIAYLEYFSLLSKWQESVCIVDSGDDAICSVKK